MFKRKNDDSLWALQQELLAAEEEEYEEETEESGGEYEEDSEYEEDWEEDSEDQEDWEEEEEEAPPVPSRLSRYGRGSPKRFEDDEFFDEEDFADEDVLYRKDYKKAVRKRRRKQFLQGLVILLELAAMAVVILWFVSWIN